MKTRRATTGLLRESRAAATAGEGGAMLLGTDSAVNLARFSNGVLLQKTPLQIYFPVWERRSPPRLPALIGCLLYAPRNSASCASANRAPLVSVCPRPARKSGKTPFFASDAGKAAPSSRSAPALRSGCPLRECRPRRPSRHFFLPPVAPEAALPSPLAPLFPAHAAGKDPSRRIPLRPQQ